MRAIDQDGLVPTDIRFGRGVVAELGDVVRSLGRAAFVCTMPDLFESGLTARAEESLRKAGVDYQVFTGVHPEPKTEHVDDAADVFRASGADVLVGLGGGSAIDFAKALAIRARHPLPIWSYVNLSNRPPSPVNNDQVIPVVAIPTTSGTGAEATWYSVMTNSETVQKGTIKEKSIFPRVALVDPELTLTLPPHLTAANGIDALAHAVESLFNVPNRTQRSDRAALQAIEIIAHALPRAVAYPSDIEARIEMSRAATIAGITISSAGTTVGHAFAQPLGARMGTSHAFSVASFLLPVLRHTLPADADRYVDLARGFGVPLSGKMAVDADAGVEAVASLLTSIGLGTGLTALRPPSELAELLADDVSTYMSRPLKQHARLFERPELVRIAEDAIRGF